MEKTEIKVEQGNRLKKCLKYRKMSQKDLAAKTYTSAVTISNIITGKAKLTNDKAVDFSRALNVRLEYLLMEDDYMTSNEMFTEPALREYRGKELNREGFKKMVEAMGLEIGQVQIDTSNNTGIRKIINETVYEKGLYSAFYDTNGKEVAKISNDDLEKIIEEVADFTKYQLSKYCKL